MASLWQHKQLAESASARKAGKKTKCLFAMACIENSKIKYDFGLSLTAALLLQASLKTYMNNMK